MFVDAKIIAQAMKELQDFPIMSSELMERLMKLTLRYFEER